MEPPVAGFACRDSGLHLARRSGARKSGLHRIDRDLNGAFAPLLSRIGRLRRCCGSRNLFSRHQERAPEKTQRQHETDTETICEAASAQIHDSGTQFSST
jgi:hypothetical protein